MVRIGRILLCVVLISAFILSGCTQGEEPCIECDPLAELVELLQLTEQQAQQLETGTGTLQLSEEQVDLIREPVEALGEELEEMLDEGRWQEVEDILNSLLNEGEANIEELRGIAEDLHEKWEPVREQPVITGLEKLSVDTALSEETVTLGTGHVEVVTIYTPADTPEDIDEGDDDFHTSWAFGEKSGLGEPEYVARVNLESGGISVGSSSWIGGDEGNALIGIPVMVDHSNTDVTITVTIRYITATVDVHAGFAETSVASVFEGEWEERFIDPPFSWDTTVKLVCKVLGLFHPALSVGCWTFTGLKLTIDLMDFPELAQALSEMEGVEEREITYNLGTMNAGSYAFHVGLHARTGAAILGVAHAQALGQVTKIEVTQTWDEEPIYFPDPNLRAAIREAIGQPTGDIYPSDLVGLTGLDAAARNIANLAGLEHCTDLTQLGLDANQISDISPLADLTNLTWLLLMENQISDISPLMNLTDLTWLGLELNQISDISSLASLTNLTHLNLDGNQISDISPLGSLTGLTWLSLPNNPISDFSPLMSLTSLTHLGLSSNGISDVSYLTNLTNLETLGLSHNEISDISPLAGLTNLTFLNLNQNQLSDISPLDGLTSLEWLEIDDNQIVDISPLANLTSLQALALYSNNISDISALAGLIGLTELWLSDNKINDISALASLTNVWELYLTHNQIDDVSPLVDNPGLGEGDVVDLVENPLSETSINAYIPELEARGVTVYY